MPIQSRDLSWCAPLFVGPAADEDSWVSTVLQQHLDDLCVILLSCKEQSCDILDVAIQTIAHLNSLIDICARTEDLNDPLQITNV